MSAPMCPAACCTGTEILCVSIPCPVDVVLLGIDLRVELPCLRVSSSSPLTGAQAAGPLNTLTNVLTTVTNSITGA